MAEIPRARRVSIMVRLESYWYSFVYYYCLVLMMMTFFSIGTDAAGDVYKLVQSLIS